MRFQIGKKSCGSKVIASQSLQSCKISSCGVGTTTILWPHCTSTALIFVIFSDKLNVIMLSINQSQNSLFFTIQRKEARATCAIWPVFRSLENSPVHDVARLPLSRSWADLAPTFRKAQRWYLRCVATSSCSLFIGKKEKWHARHVQNEFYFFTSASISEFSCWSLRSSFINKHSFVNKTERTCAFTVDIAS